MSVELRPVDRTDPRWQRIRAAITFTSSEVVADRHADFVYRIVERIPDQPRPDSRSEEATPKKRKQAKRPAGRRRRQPLAWCPDCDGMGYDRDDGSRCPGCGGSGTVAA